MVIKNCLRDIKGILTTPTVKIDHEPSISALYPFGGWLNSHEGHTSTAPVWSVDALIQLLYLAMHITSIFLFISPCELSEIARRIYLSINPSIRAS